MTALADPPADPPVDVYPSTFDAEAFEAFKREDDNQFNLQVLHCMKRARARIVRGHTKSAYVNTALNLHCAVGALYVEDVETTTLDAACGASLYRWIETKLRDSTKEAIRLLNQSAVALYPTSAEYAHWQGPLEALNQRSGFAAQSRVLKVYDHAIALQQQACSCCT